MQCVRRDAKGKRCPFRAVQGRRLCKHHVAPVGGVRRPPSRRERRSFKGYAEEAERLRSLGRREQPR
jgi:hypothetical protein